MRPRPPKDAICVNILASSPCAGSLTGWYDQDGRIAWRCLQHELEHLRRQIKSVEERMRFERWQPAHEVPS